jgi:hypothetical protein
VNATFQGVRADLEMEMCSEMGNFLSTNLGGLPSGYDKIAIENHH